jgi:outer membrane protein OmpA-like peptidoglycan-associated protein
VKVNLYDTDGNFLDTTNTDENGAYSFDIEPGINYSVDFQADGFIPKSYVLDASENNSGTIVQNVSLIKTPTVGISFLLTDRVSKKPLENVKIRITDKKTGKLVLEQTSIKSGEILKALETAKIGDVLSYSIELEKAGYLTKTISYNTIISELGVVNLSDDLEELKIGSDLALMINIKPILFDLNKYDIRKDARVELDKIVKVMNENETLEIESGSHTDCRSSYAYNEKLSDERAKASAAYIKARISNPERIYGKGYGENKLKVNCPCEGTVKSSCSEIEHQKNRRTEFVIIKY